MARIIHVVYIFFMICFVCVDNTPMQSTVKPTITFHVTSNPQDATTLANKERSAVDITSTKTLLTTNVVHKTEDARNTVKTSISFTTDATTSSSMVASGTSHEASTTHNADNNAHKVAVFPPSLYEGAITAKPVILNATLMQHKVSPATAATREKPPVPVTTVMTATTEAPSIVATTKQEAPVTARNAMTTLSAITSITATTMTAPASTRKVATATSASASTHMAATAPTAPVSTSKVGTATTAPASSRIVATATTAPASTRRVVTTVGAPATTIKVATTTVPATTRKIRTTMAAPPSTPKVSTTVAVQFSTRNSHTNASTRKTNTTQSAPSSTRKRQKTAKWSTFRKLTTAAQVAFNSSKAPSKKTKSKLVPYRIHIWLIVIIIVLIIMLLIIANIILCIKKKKGIFYALREKFTTGYGRMKDESVAPSFMADAEQITYSSLRS